MITYGGRVLNTYKINQENPISSMNSSNLVNLKGGSDTNSNPINSNPINSNPVNSNPVNSNPINSNPVNLPNSLPIVHGGGKFDPDPDEFKDKVFELFKEEPKELFAAITNAGIKGTMVGQFLGPMAWPISWVLWVINGIFTLIYYFILFCVLMFFVSVIQSGLDLVNAAIDGVLIPLKAVYDIKILGARIFGFLGGPVGDLQKTKDDMGKTTLDLFINFLKRMLA